MDRRPARRGRALLMPHLEHDRPASTWLEAWPVGDGRLGAVCWGLADGEKLSLNDDRAWSGPVGGPRHTAPADHPQRVLAARRAVLDDDAARADALMQPVVPHTQAYVPVGELLVRTPGLSAGEGLRRGLDLATATAWTHRPRPGGGVRHETFVAARAGALVHEVGVTGGEDPGEDPGEDVEVVFTSPLPLRSAELRRAGGGAVEWRALLELPLDVRPWSPGQEGEAVRWAPPGSPATRLVAVVVRALADGRTADAADDADDADDAVLVARWSGARRVRLVVAVEVPEPLAHAPGTPDVDAAARRARAALQAVERVRAAHLADHGALFGRAGLELGGRCAPGTPTDELVHRAVDDEDAHRALAELVVAHARYLLVTGSRPGTLPMTLQGLWNAELRPPWSSNYTTNVNLQMAYWPAQAWALPECAEPLLAFTERLAAEGARAAREMYDAPGWVTHHNSDGWAQTRSVGGGWADPSWSAWPFGGAWLCANLVDAVEHAADPAAVAARVLPVLEGAARFCLAWLVRLPDGTLGTAPSTSPENRWLDAGGTARAVTASSTCDLELTRGLLQAWSRLAPDEPATARLREDVREALAGLPRPRTGARGQLLEWHEDLPEAEPEHRHTSHLVGLYPLGTLDPRAEPDLAAAAARTLELRGPESTGWALAWRTALWARLGRGDVVGDLVRRCLRPAVDDAAQAGGLYPNLFSAHPPFQVDGNLGFAAGVAEALVGSTAERVDLLPALPPQWPRGRVHGLRTRAGVEVDLTWEGGRPTRARLRHLRAGTVHVAVGASACGTFTGGPGEEHDVPLPAPAAHRTGTHQGGTP
ncbi:glycosyl hydrolase family 95 catalytic domain-containing protein [Kineococcus indalonis]|uniref:glycosyl hydrolase family 95 catalytic domain-containing protein n=1 Tax=Kineococcus indalonis TaxID=2696566 RepID=UPI00141214F0|nr:glycoside hydrolase N-terminal domain-containing protein [Kineococcus indalonis]NAZ85358.1 alpha-L-fucosidase [Kineococcus indalonis]